VKSCAQHCEGFIGKRKDSIYEWEAKRRLDKRTADAMEELNVAIALRVGQKYASFGPESQ